MAARAKPKRAIRDAVMVVATLEENVWRLLPRKTTIPEYRFARESASALPRCVSATEIPHPRSSDLVRAGIAAGPLVAAHRESSFDFL